MSVAFVFSIILVVALGASAIADFLAFAPRAAMIRRLGLKKGTETQLGVMSLVLIVLLGIGHGHGALTTVVASFLVGYFLVALALHRRVNDKALYSFTGVALAGALLGLALFA